MIPDELNFSGQELQILSELDSKQYGQLKDNAKKRALVTKVMIRWGVSGEILAKNNCSRAICECGCERDSEHTSFVDQILGPPKGTLESNGLPFFGHLPRDRGFLSVYGELV